MLLSVHHSHGTAGAAVGVFKFQGQGDKGEFLAQQGVQAFQIFRVHQARAQERYVVGEVYAVAGVDGDAVLTDALVGADASVRPVAPNFSPVQPDHQHADVRRGHAGNAAGLAQV